MNPLLKFIFDRRSIRRYESRAIPEETVTDLLEAAMAAPSAVAKDPWHFIVVRKRETLDALSESLPNGRMLRYAPLGIVVCGDLEATHDRQESYMLQDCSAAIENLLLAATALGLGACWLGAHPREERMARIRQLLALPSTITPVSAIAIGWPDASKDARTRYREDAVHHERW